MTKVSVWDMADYLKSEKDVAEYLQCAFEDGDPEYIAFALGTAARARGMLKTSKKTGLNRSALYKSLKKDGNPRLSTFTKVVDALGYKLSIVPKN
jgi:probable addiction module antidote protein